MEQHVKQENCGSLRRLPATYMGFPVTGRQRGELAAAAGTEGKRGIALIIAIMIISVMMLLTSDLILSSQVNITLATTARDNLKAEYMAKSGLNAAMLLLSSDFAYDLYQAQQDPKAGLTDGLGDIWSALNGLPIGGETIEMLGQFQEQFDLNAVLDSNVIDQLKLFDGQFILDVADESQKINVNYCATSRCSETIMMLEALFACPAEKAFLEQKKLSGREMAYRIKDWIDADNRAEEASGYNDENEPYQKREPKLHAKNAPMDTIDELRQIEGWDEEMQAVFSPHITIFPFQQSSTDKKFKININTASRALLQCLFPESRGDCSEKSALALKKRNDEGLALGMPGQKVSDILRDTLCYAGGDGNAGEANNRANWFAQNSMIYRVQTSGVVGNSEKKVTAVIERTMPDPKKKEKATYKLLFFKII